MRILKKYIHYTETGFIHSVSKGQPYYIHAHNKQQQHFSDTFPKHEQQQYVSLRCALDLRPEGHCQVTGPADDLQHYQAGVPGQCHR